MPVSISTAPRPWQHWQRLNFQELLDAGPGTAYGIFISPEIRWTLQSVISPVDASARITAGVSWNVFQGLTLLAFVSGNAGNDQAVFAWDRSTSWPDHSPNGLNITLGARYSY